MVVNAMDWEMVDVKNVARGSRMAQTVRIYPKNNSIVVSGDLVQDAGWTGDCVRVSLYKSGNLFMFKPARTGVIYFRAKYATGRDGTKKQNGRALTAHSFPVRSTLCMTADTDNRFAKHVDFDAWVDGDSILLKFKESVYAEEKAEG